MVAKTLIIAGTALLAAAAASLPAAAQQGNPRGGNGPGVLGNIDTNRDGAVEKSEADAAFSAAFARADRNNDGKLTGDELRNAFQDLVGRIVTERFRNGPGANAQNNGRGGNNGRFGPGFDPRQFRFGPGPQNPYFYGPQSQPPFRGYGPFGPGFQAPNNQPPRPNRPGAQGPNNQPQFQAPNRPGFQAPFAPGFNGPNNNQPQLGLGNNGRGGNANRGPGPQAQGPGNPPQAVPTPPTPPAPQGNAGRGGNPSIFAEIDRNGDGVITRDEFAAAFGGVR